MSKINFSPGIGGPKRNWGLLLELLQDIRDLLEALRAERVKGLKAVRKAGALEIVPLKSSSFHARQDPDDPAFDPTFPRSFPLGESGRATAWYVHELEDWLEKQASKRDSRGQS